MSIPITAVRLGSASDETEESVQYVALIYADEDAWSGFSQEERDAAYGKYRAFGEEARAAGVLAAGNELGSTRDATTVRVRDETLDQRFHLPGIHCGFAAKLHVRFRPVQGIA